MTKKACILSIDGGGIRGILPGVIVSYIEGQLRKKEGDHVRISDYFDLIAGTSTGGILTTLYVAPDEKGRPKYTADQAVELYLNNGGKIFSLPFYRKLLNPFGIRKPKYPFANIEKLLKNYLGDLELSQALKPCLITSYEIFQRKTIFFNMVDTLKSDKDLRNFLLRDIARATSAAPTYFKPALIKSKFGSPYYLIDGGVFANNPAMCAFAEANTSKFSQILNRSDKPDYPLAPDIIMVSIGTGSQGEPYYYDKAKHWGVVGWLQPLIDILMSGNSETVHYELVHLFSKSNPTKQGQYFRLEPKVETASSKMDLATDKNMLALQEAGKMFVSENYETIDQIIDLLIANK
jgi:uncharacterized protein